MEKITKLTLGVLVGVLIPTTIYAFQDPIAASREKDQENYKNLQATQFQIKQLENELSEMKSLEKKDLKTYCLGLRDTATLLLEEGENDETDISKWKKLKTQSCEDYYTNTLKEVYTGPRDLYFTFMKADGTYISQNIKQHFYRNGYMAVDIGTSNQELNVRAPSYIKSATEDLEREYTVELIDYPKTTGRTMLLKWEEEGVEMSFLLGHLKKYLVNDGDIVKTGDIIAISGGDPGDEDMGATTGRHMHLEFRIDGVAVPYPAYLYTQHKTDGKTEIVEAPVDLDKLAYAVAQAETSNCTKGAGITHKNCHGIMEWPNGVRQLKHFNSTEESFKEFKELWAKKYKTFPDYDMADKYAGSDRVDTWLKNVTFYYGL